jgi:hypothetical protein
MGAGSHRKNFSPLVGEIEWGVRGFAARGPSVRTPTPAPPHKGEGLFQRVGPDR